MEQKVFPLEKSGIEITEDLSGDEIIVFGGMIDLGTKIKKTKEYAGVGQGFQIFQWLWQ